MKFADLGRSFSRTAHAATVGIICSSLICTSNSARAEDFASSSVALLGPSLSSISVGSLHTPNGSMHNGKIEWDPMRGDLQGWNYLAAKLVDAGVSVSEVAETFSDARMPARSDMFFSLDPRESKAAYRKHNSVRNRAHALRFFAEHESSFRYAAKRFFVPEGVILAILQVETACGKNTGRSRVIPALARLANANEPANLEINRARFSSAKDKQRAELRAAYLERTFFPHLVAAFKLAHLLKLPPLELSGSSAGAVGTPQFLPGHYFSYGADGDGDRHIHPLSSGDAIISVASFLHAHGWESKRLSQAAQRKVIWEYNHSEPYIDTVLSMATLLQSEINRSASR